MTPSVPAIYTLRAISPKLGVGARLGAAAVMLGCGAVLWVASVLSPSPTGVGTHTNLQLPQCTWIERFDVPCPSCGMTTSFSHFVRGNLLAAFYVQPMGAVLAMLTAAAFWVSLYIAVTGRPAVRLVRLIPVHYYLLPLALFAVAAWGWKIYIHLHGIDGWR